MAQNTKPQDVKLDITPEVAQGIYSNLVIISHSPSEIVLDFAQMLPGSNNPSVRTRTIMSPIHAKRLLAALNDNIQKYEAQFGPIVEPAPAGDTIGYDQKLLGKA